MDLRTGWLDSSTAACRSRRPTHPSQTHTRRLQGKKHALFLLDRSAGQALLEALVPSGFGFVLAGLGASGAEDSTVDTFYSCSSKIPERINLQNPPVYAHNVDHD